MSPPHEISIALTDEQLQQLQRAVDGGEYATTSDTVREAIEEWQLKRNLLDTETLRALWDEGKASGEPTRMDWDQLRRESRARLTEAKRT